MTKAASPYKSTFVPLYWDGVMESQLLQDKQSRLQLKNGNMYGMPISEAFECYSCLQAWKRSNSVVTTEREDEKINVN